MDFPLVISPPIPAWPLKRKVNEVLDLSNIKPQYGPGLQVVDGETQLSLDSTLEINNNDQVTVNSNLVKPYRGQEVFVPGEFDSAFFRIPVLLQLSSGGLLAFGITKDGASGDHVRSSICLAISSDGGLTWPVRFLVLVPPTDQQRGRFMDPCVVEDTNGIVHLFAVYFQNSNHATEVDPDYDFVHVQSSDGGYTWSLPDSLKSLKKANETYFFECPGIGITLYNGVIVIPCQAWAGTTFFSTIIYSSNGVDWVRAAADGTASVFPPMNTSEAQIAEFPVNGQIIMVARREGGSGLENMSRVVIYTTDLGASWSIHQTNGTIRQSVPCMASLLRIVSPADEWVLLLCAPNATASDNMYGRSEMTLQCYTDRQLEWRLVGLVHRQPTLGYSCLALDTVYNRLYVLLEEYVNDNTGSALILRDISRFFGSITSGYNLNVNLGLVVTVEPTSCSVSTDPVVYTVYNGEVWIYGVLLPPDGGSFPSDIATMFSFSTPGWFVNKGWFPVFGTDSTKPYSVNTFLFEYIYSNQKIVVRCFAAPPTGPKLADMKKIYIPAVRLCAFQ
ncbi:sialidase [psittacine adenovirus 6]|uniref:Sialidase n=1 Tax=psittacine adenovirus 6 TaxID=3071234 RepID=A0AAE6X4U8_9ADEN|nr:sialidase [psittacine adenovirus 6]